MSAQGALLAVAVPALLGLTGLSAWLTRRARGAQAVSERSERLLAAVGDIAGEVAGASDDPIAAVATRLERAGLVDVAVLVPDDASGRWLVWSRAGEQAPAPHPHARAAQRAWERGETVADDPDGAAGAPIACPIPLPSGVSAVLAARARAAVPTEAERAAVEACAGLLGASGLPSRGALPERQPHEAHARGPVDSLTGLVAASALRSALQERCRDPQTPVALLLVATDGVDAVSDRLGGRSGDEVLRIAGRRLQRCVRPDDILARMEPTVFGILLSDGTHPDGSAVVGERAREALASPVAVTAGSVRVSVRVGLVWDATDDADEARLLSEARAALARSEGDVVTTIRLGPAAMALRGRPR